MKTRFSKAAADKACAVFEKALVHTKGTWARQPFKLAPFQRDDIIRPLFGQQVYDPDEDDWVRQYTLGWMEMARKNGKSEVLAGVAILLTGFDDEEGAEVYGVAKDTDQASLVFDVARRMLELSGHGGPPRSGLPFIIYPTNRRIVYTRTSSFYRVIAADALGNLGQNPHGILFDEVIAQPNGELWDALKTGFGTRRQPLMLAATTPGDDTAEFARQEHEFSLKVAADPSLDPRRFVFMRNLPKEADWRDESLWGDPNPALGIFLKPQVLRDELTSAQNNPREERRFRMFRLAQWQSGGLEGWAGSETWSVQGNIQMIDQEQLQGRRCWAGIVAASASDLAAAAWTFHNPQGRGTCTLWDYWLPEDRLPDLNRRTAGKAATWAAEGQLQLTPGNEIDIETIVQAIRDRAAQFDVRELAYFAGNALGIVQPIIDEGVVKATAAISANASGSALVDWEQALAVGEYRHGGNPVTAWTISHLQVRETLGGTPRIDIKGSPENVYGAVAAEFALRRLLVAKTPPRSAYSADRGLITA